MEEIISAKKDKNKNEAAKVLTENLEKVKQHNKRAGAVIETVHQPSDKGTAQEFFDDKKNV